MKIRIANSAGFCYGVRRAVELAEGAARSGEPCVMLGPIIHNQDMMDHLARHGLRAVVRPEEVPEGSEVIIRDPELIALLLQNAVSADMAYYNPFFQASSFYLQITQDSNRGIYQEFMYPYGQFPLQ